MLSTNVHQFPLEVGVHRTSPLDARSYPREDASGIRPSTSPASNNTIIKDEGLSSLSKGNVTPFRPKSWRFWAIMAALAFTGLLTALEATITSTALPSIVADLGGGELYIWAINGYFLAMTSLQPLVGQLANIFGRRWPTIIATAIFIFGSGICAGAGNFGMLIAGRVIQGIGAAGLNVLVEVIIADLVPLRERGTYFSIVFGFIALGTALGPFFGGLIVDNTTWRWVFYLNLPVGGVALMMLVLFLKVEWNKEMTLTTKLTKIDWIGNLIFVAAISSILIALSWAGAVYPWSSYHVLAPLIIGIFGTGAFVFFEGSRFAVQPTVPLHLFSNRTSSTGFALTFLHSTVTMWVLYFIPVYFQGVLGSTPGRSGVQLLPTILTLIPFGAIGGTAMSKTGRYKPIHYAAYAMMIIGFGLLALLDEGSSTGKWAGFQIIESAGAGLVIATLLPAVMAPLTEADTALATATWAFMRSFGLTWGTAIPAAIFNNRFSILAQKHIVDPALREQLQGGRAYEHATKAFRDSLTTVSREQFVWVLNESLRRTWLIAIAFATLGFLIVSFEKEIPLRSQLETEYGMTGGSAAKTTEPGDIIANFESPEQDTSGGGKP